MSKIIPKATTDGGGNNKTDSKTDSKSAPNTGADGDADETDDKDLAEFGDIVRTVQSLGVGIGSNQSPGVAAITASPSFGPLGSRQPIGGSPKDSPALGPTKGDINAVIGAPALGAASTTVADAKSTAVAAATASATAPASDAKDAAGSAMLMSGSVATGGDDSDDDAKTKDPNAELKDIGDIPSKSKKFYDVRVAVVGNVDSGKSTLVGVLTGGALDNGRGLARSRIFVHQHEQANGRTSCISQHIMGFDTKDNAVYQSQPASASSAQKTKSWKAVVSASRSLVTFIDLAGHERYLKTTIAGLTGCFPDYAIVIINALAGISKMTREHLGVILALEIPFACIVSKIDMCPANVLERTKNQLFRILKSQHAKKLPITVRDEKDIATCLDNNQSMRICPVFLCSAVTGKGMDLLIKYLGGLKPRRDWQITRKDKLTEFHIDETFNVTGVGIVISGTVSSGTLTENSTLLMGPGEDGTFKEVQVKTIHCKRVAVDKCEAGDSCAISLRATKRREPLKRSAIRRGMVLVDPAIKPTSARNFEAEVLVLHHPTTIKMSYQAVIHCGIIRQTAAITNISKDCLRTGDKALVSFRFMIRPEYLHLGSVFIFREGNTKGIGKISKIIYQDDPNLAALSTGVTPPKKRAAGAGDANDDPDIETDDAPTATTAATAATATAAAGTAAVPAAVASPATAAATVKK